MQVPVNGHKGYIGTICVPIMLAEGFDVVGLDIDLYARSTFLDNIVAIPEINKDVRDIEPDDLRGFDAVVPWAALSNDPLGNLNPNLTYKSNWINQWMIRRYHWIEPFRLSLNVRTIDFTRMGSSL